MHFRRTSRTTVLVGLALLTCLTLSSAASATALAPFIDLQEKGLTVSSAGVGTQGWDGSPRNLTLNVGGPVRFALLYWAGRQRPCDETSPGVCGFTATPYRDQQMIFDGNNLTGTIIGSEWQPVSGGGPIMNVGYYADVTSIVAAKGTGSKTFTFADGDKNSNLWRLNGVGLLVAYTDPGNPNYYRVIVWDGLDFAYGEDPTSGDNRVTAPVVFNHGVNLADRDGDLWILTGDGTPDRPENITISNNPTLFNVVNGVSGFDWDTDDFPLHVPASVGTTTVQVNSLPVGQNPDSLLWEVAAVRLPALDVAPARCPLTVVSGPPTQAIVKVQDIGSGISSIVVTKSQNADTPVPPFTVGTTDPVTVTATKIDQTKSSQVSLLVTDQAGNQAVCDPIMTMLVRDPNQPENQTFRSVPQAENKISILNGIPGLRSIEAWVNGVKYKAKDLKSGENTVIDITGALHAGENNVVTLKGKGPKGATADIIIWDGNGQ
jgi:Protein of unknown function (DUF3344)